MTASKPSGAGRDAPSHHDVMDRMTPDSAKGGALIGLLQHGPLETAALQRHCGVLLRGRHSLCRHVGIPLVEAGLVERIGRGVSSTWEITDAGRDAAQRLLARAQSAPPAAPTGQLPARREHGPTGALPRGEYRCPRAGAYDFERCPSRMGDRLVYRDSRQAVAVD